MQTSGQAITVSSIFGHELLDQIVILLFDCNSLFIAIQTWVFLL
jgi:hypothetical protein